LKKYILLLIIFLLAVSSCAYYNTFFHAERSFKKARKEHLRSKLDPASGGVATMYDDAIKRASKILTYYPKSKWVDDALFMIGQSFYYKGEYSKAERKFKELLVAFPQSEFAEDCNFFLALCAYKMEDYSKAQRDLEQIVSEPKKRKNRIEAISVLGELHFKQKEYDQAIEQYQRVLKESKNERLAREAQFNLAECYFLKKDYAQALEAFSKLKDFKSTAEELYYALSQSGECEYLLGEYQKGLDIFWGLSKEEKYFTHLSAIRLKIAQGKMFLGNIDEAVDIYKKITVENPKTDESAEAYYQLGEIYESKIIDFKKAKENYDLASKEKYGSESAKKALQKSAAITKMEDYQAQLSKEESDKSIETFFLLAEIYLIQLDQPDSALKEYLLLVEKYPKSEYAPKALFASAWIWENVKKDSSEAFKLYQRLLNEYPGGDYAQLALKSLSPSIDSFPQLADSSRKTVSAEKVYLEAESLLFKENRIDSALTLFKYITQNFPKTLFGAKAQYAYAWVTENYLHPEDSSGVLAYQKLLDEYPGTEYTESAMYKLGKKKPAGPGKKEEKKETAPADSSDTLKTSPVPPAEVGVPKAPTPIKRGTYIYPVSQRESGIKGMVRLKIIIDFEGKVKEAEILNSLGNFEIDEAAQKAALETVFSPDSIPVMNLGGWFLFDVEVRKPGQDDSHTDQTPQR
jgi:TonB family protein